jgi:hypothetical protein
MHEESNLKIQYFVLVVVYFVVLYFSFPFEIASFLWMIRQNILFSLMEFATIATQW